MMFCNHESKDADDVEHRPIIMVLSIDYEDGINHNDVVDVASIMID